MKTLYTILATILFILFFGTTRDAQAYECGKRQAACVYYWQSDAVFIGRVIEVSPDVKESGINPHFRQRAVLLSIERAFRGVRGEQTQLLDSSVNKCEFVFETGEAYFVYARQDYKTKTWSTSAGSGTVSLAQAQEDLAHAEDVSKGIYEVSIGGLVVEYMPIPDATILVQGAGRQYQTKPDKDGRFRIDVPAGKYAVQIILPPGYIASDEARKVFKVLEKDGRITLEYYVQVGPRSCNFLPIATFCVNRSL
jgi:hypothetical protein